MKDAKTTNFFLQQITNFSKFSLIKFETVFSALSQSPSPKGNRAAGVQQQGAHLDSSQSPRDIVQ